MLDMLGNEVKLQDGVVYLYLYKGKITTISGRVLEIKDKKAKINTQNGILNVKNIIKISEVKKENKFDLFKLFKKV